MLTSQERTERKAENTFRPMARIISQIGDQLISNEETALLELIKNAYDAKAKHIEITIDQVKKVMTIKDNGIGMTMEQVKNNWLVLGTNNRYIEKNQIDRDSIRKISSEGKISHNNAKKEDAYHVPLGEKGLGRFSTKKLSNRLLLVTKTKNERHLNLLRVDWKEFDYSSDKYLDEITMPTRMIKINNEEQFTILRMSKLKKISTWKIEFFYKWILSKVSKFINPFKDFNTNRINNLEIEFIIYSPVYDENNKLVGKAKKVINTTELSNELVKQAHHKIYGKVENDRAIYTIQLMKDGKVAYEEVDKIYDLNDNNDLTRTEEGEVGNFNFAINIFNRSRLPEIKGFGNTKEIRNLLDNYCGGVMLYRDGFRVLPYGDIDNDWMKVNTKSWLKSKGVRFYTLQVLGYVNISSLINPNLVDQTNRQGIQNNDAYDNLISILWGLLDKLSYTVSQFENKDKEIKKKDLIIDTKENIRQTECFLGNLIKSVQLINEQKDKSDNYILENELRNVSNTVEEIRKEMDKQSNFLKDIDTYIKNVANKEEMLFFLSSTGLTAEIVSHELGHLLDNCKSFITDIEKIIPKEKRGLARSLKDNMKSIRALVSRIDEHDITRRRIKTNFDLISEFIAITSNLQNKLKVKLKDGRLINIKIKVISDEDNIYVKANKGLIIQVFLNLLSNSIYWLNAHCETKDNYNPEICLVYENGYLYFYDNGKGIQLIDSSRVFEQFFSTRSNGRGLGLYIIKEICNFHNIDIELLDDLNMYGRNFKFGINISNILQLD